MPNWRVNWPSLKSLFMESCNDCSKAIENIVSGSPLLEWIDISSYSCNDDSVTIISESLTVLTFDCAPVTSRISCPNLVEFSVLGEGISSQLLENVLSGNQLICSLRLEGCFGYGNLVISSEYLKVLYLEYDCDDTDIIEVSCPNLEKLDFISKKGNIFNAVNLPSSVCADIHFRDSDSLKQLLEQFQHVNKLTIGGSFFQIVSDLGVEARLSLLLLNSECLARPGIAYALRLPTLETLVIKLDHMYYEDTLDNDLHDYWNSNGSTFLASRLKTVEIAGLNEKYGKCQLVLKFIEFVLKSARALEKMTVSLLEESRTCFVIELYEQLLSFSRCSQVANVELLYSTKSDKCRKNLNVS